MFRTIQDLPPTRFIYNHASQLSQFIIDQTTQITSSLYGFVRGLSINTHYEEPLWMKAYKRSDVIEYRAWCAAIKKEFQEIVTMLEQRRIDPRVFREEMLSANERFQDTMLSPWYYSQWLKWLERQCRNKFDLPEVYGDACREAYLKLHGSLRDFKDESNAYFHRDLIHIVIKISNKSIRPKEGLSVLGYYKGLVSEEIHRTAQSHLEVLFKQQFNQISANLTMLDAKNSWQQECKKACIELEGLFKSILDKRNSVLEKDGTANVVSQSIIQKLYSRAKKGVEYTKSHPAQAFTLLAIGSVAVQKGYTNSCNLQNGKFVGDPLLLRVFNLNNQYDSMKNIEAVFSDVGIKVASITMSFAALQQNLRRHSVPTLSASMFAMSLIYYSNGVKAVPVNGQFPAVIQVSSISGANGFELNGVAANDQSGCSVGTAGDVNHDGIDDIIIGAYGASSSAGKTYVVFGKTNWNSPLSLSTLNGNDGFELDGVTVGDYSGCSVSTAGDVNDDGIDDVIIGAYGASSSAGKTYVVFGKTNWTSPLSLSTLNGTNGFELDGVAGQDLSGISISTAGDVNHDGINDIIIGAAQVGSPGAGKTYVVFGKPNWTSPLSLSTLNGTNGFELNGVSGRDWSGRYVSAAGDINHDGIDDIIIAANSASSGTGKTYVVFGKSNWTSPISLSTLNGTSGFELDGVVGGEESGVSCTQAGDVNHDGIDDMIIGAPWSSSRTGKTYVVFGKANWVSPISLSVLNGSNGFEIDGVAAGDQSGWSVSQAGDVNHDGIQDIIIGAFGASSSTGKTYVVFGKTNWTSPLLLSTLNGSNGFEIDGATAGDQSGYSVSNARDINHDGIDDVIIGAWQSPSGAGKVYVLFGDSPPVLVNNRLTVVHGTAVFLNSSNLLAYDLNHANDSLIFVPSTIVAGYFQASSNPGVYIYNFTQAQISNGIIQFVHDGSKTTPSYDITVRSSGFALVGPVSANISFSFLTSSPSIVPIPNFSSTALTIQTTTDNFKSPMSMEPVNPESSKLPLILGATLGGIICLLSMIIAYFARRHYVQKNTQKIREGNVGEEVRPERSSFELRSNAAYQASEWNRPSAVKVQNDAANVQGPMLLHHPRSRRQSRSYNAVRPRYDVASAAIPQYDVVGNKPAEVTSDSYDQMPSAPIGTPQYDMAIAVPPSSAARQANSPVIFSNIGSNQYDGVNDHIARNTAVNPPTSHL